MQHLKLQQIQVCYTCHTQHFVQHVLFYHSCHTPAFLWHIPVTPATHKVTTLHTTCICHTCHTEHLRLQQVHVTPATYNTSCHRNLSHAIPPTTISCMLHITFSCNTCCQCYTKHLQYTSVSVMHNTFGHTLHLLQHISVTKYTSCDTYVCHRDCGLTKGYVNCYTCA